MAPFGFALFYRPIYKHLLFWLAAGTLLTLIYGTAYGSFGLGVVVILTLLPIHMAYFYTMIRGVLPSYILTGKYIHAVIATILVMVATAVAYRLAEIFVANPFIYNYYLDHEVKITWPQISWPWWQQLRIPIEFVNALERTNVVVWIGISLKFVSLLYERKQAAMRAELDALKAQLHPHFLFNSLNNVYSFALDNSPRTAEALLRLSSILRYVLYEGSAAKVSLKKELDVLESYINLEKIRYEQRLELNFNVRGHVNSQEIAPLIMLPLVENAFKHGASETLGTPWINIDVVVNVSEFTFKVSNSKPDTQQSAATPESRIGLSNVKKRLALLYGGRHSFRVHDDEDVFVVELKLLLS